MRRNRARTNASRLCRLPRGRTNFLLPSLALTNDSSFGDFIINKKSPEDEWFVKEGNVVRPPGGRHSRESAIRRFRRTRIGSEVEFVFPVKARIT